MHAFVVFCMIAMAAAQYDYTPGTSPPADAGNLVLNGQAQLSEPIHPAQSNEFSKEFYTYTAPEHEFDDAHNNEQIASALKKNVRVLFIKGPENSGLENAALQLASSAADDRTAIYVLSKQADVSELANKLNQIKSNNHQKPEVHFVKYRTQADADNAQRTIQSQYDSLPGPSSNHNAGTSPVLDFATKAASSAPSASGFTSPSNSEYLPPHRRF